MSDVQIAVIDQQDTQIVLAVPGVQGATGSPISAGGTANQVLRKASSTNYDTDWSLVTNAMVDSSAAIAGTKISPNFGSQNVVTTGTSTAASFIPTSSSVPTNGVYLPSANNVAISTNGTGRLFVDASGNVNVGTTFAGFGNGSGVEIQRSTTATLRLTGNSGVGCEFYNTGSLASIQTRSSIPFTIQTNEVERLRITSDGKLGLGTSSPGSRLTVNIVNFADASATGATTLSNAGITVEAAADTNNRLMFGIGSTGGAPWIQAQNTSSNATRSLILNPVGGSVGIGTSTVNTTLEVLNSSAPIIRVGDGTRHMELRGGSTTQNAAIGTNYAGGFDIIQNGSAAVTIDTSKRLLVGTSSTSSNTTLLLQGYSGTTGPGVLRCCTTTNGPTSTEDLGYIMFGDATHVNAAWIQAQRDGGTWTAGSSYPGRLVFSVTADGASSPTEAMRIKNSRILNFANTPTYADNTAAKAGGLVDGDVYRKSDGTLMIVYT
jgi:hypothetical protein